MNKEYATLSTRVKAAVIDSIVIIVTMYTVTEIIDLFNTVPNFVRILVFVFIFFLYEPILVTIYGATIGHFFNDIVVKKEQDEEKNINFFSAILRYTLKIALGWVSLLTITGNEKSQAIHDKVVNSVVKPYKKITK